MVIYNNLGNQTMSELFPPISQAARINTRYEPRQDPLPIVERQSYESRRVFADKEIIDTTHLTTYDRGGNLKTVIQTSQQVVDFIV